MNNYQILLLFIGVLLGFLFIFRKRQTKENLPLDNRKRIKDLILGKAKAKVYTTNYGFRVDDEEIVYTMWRHHYMFGKMFEAASKSPKGELKLTNGDKIAPYSRDHGLKSGRSADKLRAMVILQYGIDLATMEDLEEDEALAQERKNKALLSIKENLDDLPNLPKNS